MRKILALLMGLCLLLSGCSFWSDGSYSSVEPHKEPANQTEKTTVTVLDYEDLVDALKLLVESGAEGGILSMQYDGEDAVRADMDKAILNVCENNPFALYAVEHIQYVFGASGVRNAVSVQISYAPSRTQVDKIHRVQTPAETEQIIAKYLDACDDSLVLYVKSAEELDYAQMAADYALAYPQKVIEAPQVTVRFYPEQAQSQIVEIKFSYQTSREQLRTFQNKVAPVFSSASRYVSGEWTAAQKAEMLYAFVMNRYDYYDIQTSITPVYSLLLHGIGDSQAFAMAYAAMCRQASLNAYVISGTRDGAPWVWNAVQIDGEYYYIDLLRCNEGDGFRLYTQAEMTNYVWDSSAYPVAEEK